MRLESTIFVCRPTPPPRKTKKILFSQIVLINDIVLFIYLFTRYCRRANTVKSAAIAPSPLNVSIRPLGENAAPPHDPLKAQGNRVLRSDGPTEVYDTHGGGGWRVEGRGVTAVYY